MSKQMPPKVISGGDNPYDIHDAKLSSSATAHESSSVTAHEISNSYGYLSKTYGVPAKRNIEEWVHNYQKFGDVGLIRSRKNQTYSFEKKLSVVELYLSSEISYQDLALQEGITNPSMIVDWVNRFRVAGPDALRPHKKGRRKTLEKPEKKSSTLPIESSVDTSAEHVKELEDELLKLRIENAFLKELRRLRLEDEAKMRERRESSTVSEDSLN